MTPGMLRTFHGKDQRAPGPREDFPEQVEPLSWATHRGRATREEKRAIQRGTGGFRAATPGHRGAGGQLIWDTLFQSFPLFLPCDRSDPRNDPDRPLAKSRSPLPTVPSAFGSLKLFFCGSYRAGRDKKV